MNDYKVAYAERTEVNQALGRKLADDLIQAQDGCGSPLPAVVAIALLLGFIPQGQTPAGREAFLSLINLTLKQMDAPWHLVMGVGHEQ